MRRKNVLIGLSLIALFSTSACEKDEISDGTVTVTETFETGANGWEAVFGSYPEGEEEFYELAAGVKALPVPLDQTKKSYMLSGNNHSDALRMFLAKQIGGFTPGAAYELDIKLKLASKYPQESSGIGGSPGGAVHLVAYASANGYEKKYTGSTEEPGYFEIEIKKDTFDNKAQSEAELGTVGIEGDEFEYELIERTNDESMICKADTQGKIWVVLGTWSGFEGITTLYYDEIELKFYSKP
ncbi:MAG: hypothetical protein RBS73_09100 [Prolixibacteraceae bacterium]|jgi:hypothetical protein|nr:hypothetical protein [Prolixibacteraceae bacterium]